MIPPSWAHEATPITELDWTLGKVIESLQKQNLLENTLIIMSSDNGGVVDDGYQDQAVQKTRLSSSKRPITRRQVFHL